MRIKNLLWITIPVFLHSGCATYHDNTYAEPSVVTPSPTSSTTAVRVYPETSQTTVGSPVDVSPIPAEEWSAAVAVRNMIAADPYLKGAARDVDIEVVRGAAILRGTVVSEYDRHELAARVGQIPGIATVDNRLVVAH